MPPEERNSLAERYINAVGRDALLGTEVDYHAAQMQNGVGVPESEGIGKNNAAQVRLNTGLLHPLLSPFPLAPRRR